MFFLSVAGQAGTRMGRSQAQYRPMSQFGFRKVEMLARWKFLLLIATGVIAALAAVLWLIAPEPLPPLLRDARAAGGWWGACPPEGDGRKTLALSPELNQRLQDQFPSGTTEQHLIQVLTNQGFQRTEACKSDPTIHVAAFRRRDVRAAVYWKSDGAGNITWTKGFIFYVSL